MPCTCSPPSIIPPLLPPPPYYLALAVCLQALRRGALHVQPDPLDLGQGVRPGGQVGNLRVGMVACVFSGAEDRVGEYC